MVKKSLIITVVLVVAYNIFITYCKVKPVGQYTFQNNLIKAEDYMYTDSLKDADLIIGTSISAKINQDKLPKNVFLVAGAGFSVYDGIDLVQNVGGHPKYVFIEENSINLPERPDFIKYLFNAPDYYRKKYLVSQRDDYQPAGEFYNATYIHTAPRITFFSHYFFNPLIGLFCKGHVIPVNTADYYADAKMKAHVDTGVIKRAFERLQVKVHELEKQGTTVCFYGVPNDPKVYYGLACQTILNDFPRFFPPSKYTYLPHPNIYLYHTTDQIHMDDTSCTKFTYDLAKKIEVARNIAKKK